MSRILKFFYRKMYAQKAKKNIRSFEQQRGIYEQMAVQKLQSNGIQNLGRYLTVSFNLY